MTIVKLAGAEKRPDVFYAEFEDGSRLAVNAALVADFSLYAGRELGGDEYAALMEAAAKSQAKARALRILGSRSMSRREITDRLIKKGESEEVAGETADWLSQIGAVNDAEYAAAIVRHYAGRGYGEMRVKDELYRRGIPKELWEDALAQLPDTEEKAYGVLCAKLGGGKPDQAALKRASGALYRRGFSWDDIKAAVTKYKAESDSGGDSCDMEDLSDEE